MRLTKRDIFQVAELCVASPFSSRELRGLPWEEKYFRFGVSINGVITVLFEWPEKEVSAMKVTL